RSSIMARGSGRGRGILPGRKLQKTGGGTYQPVIRRSSGLGSKPASSKVPKESYLKSPALVRDSRPPVPQRRLTKQAEKLLAEYYRRVSFWEACHDAVPIEWAGQQLLGVKKVRAYEILREMQARGGPEGWFQAQALEGMRQGKIGRGRATK